MMLIYYDKRITINVMHPSIIYIYLYNNPLRECFAFALRDETTLTGWRLSLESVCMPAKYPL